MLLKGLKVCNLYGHFSLFSWDLHGVTAWLYCTWMSTGDFVAWGITFLNLSFSHARTKACRNVYQIRKHRAYFIAQWAATQWYQTMYNETFQMVYFLLDTSVWTCLICLRTVLNDTKSYIIIYCIFCQKLIFVKKFHQRFQFFSCVPVLFY